MKADLAGMLTRDARGARMGQAAGGGSCFCGTFQRVLARAGACRTCVGTASSGACSSRRPAGAPVAPGMALGVAMAGGCGMAAGVAVAAGAPLCAGAGVSAGAPGGAGAGAPTGASSGTAAATAAGGTAAAAATAARYLAPIQGQSLNACRTRGGSSRPARA